MTSSPISDALSPYMDMDAEFGWDGAPGGEYIEDLVGGGSPSHERKFDEKVSEMVTEAFDQDTPSPSAFADDIANINARFGSDADVQFRDMQLEDMLMHADTPDEPVTAALFADMPTITPDQHEEEAFDAEYVVGSPPRAQRVVYVHRKMYKNEKRARVMAAKFAKEGASRLYYIFKAGDGSDKVGVLYVLYDIIDDGAVPRGFERTVMGDVDGQLEHMAGLMIDYGPK